MSFWGIEVKPTKPFLHSCEKSKGRLRITQATLGIGDATRTSLVQCTVGKSSPVLLCALLPGKTESCHLDLEFAEAYDVQFSLIGPRSVFLTGYYVHQNDHGNAQSDSESFGVDIENSEAEGSSYKSEDDDTYEDSFIDDDEVKVSPPSPVLSAEDAMHEDSLDNDPSKAYHKQHKKKYQVVESDSDEREDEDGYLLSVFTNRKRNAKQSVSDDDEKSAQGNKWEEKVDDMNGETERETSLPLHNQEKDLGTEITVNNNENENELTVYNDSTNKDLPPIANEEDQIDTVKPKRKRKVRSNKEEKTTQGVDAEAKVPIDNQGTNMEVEVTVNNNNENAALTDDNANKNLPNGKDLMQSRDSVKPKKKRKERPNKEEKTTQEVDLGEIDVNGSAPVPTLESENPRKKRKELQSEGIVTECVNNIPKDEELKEQGVVNATDQPDANGEEYEEQRVDNDVIIKPEPLSNDNPPEKKVKKKTKKKPQVESNLKTSMTNIQETTTMKNEDQTANAPVPIKTRTLSNGLIIEDVENGPPDGKVAEPGKKLKVYYTAILKESGHVFDSNIGKTPCRFSLGDEKFIQGLNIGIEGMRVGDKRRLIIPPSLGYENRGDGENVPPNSWLVYDVELANVHRR